MLKHVINVKTLFFYRNMHELHLLLYFTDYAIKNKTCTDYAINK